MSSSTISSDLSRKLSILSSQDCFENSSGLGSVKIYTTLPTSVSSDGSTDSCRTEPSLITKPAHVSDLVGTKSNLGSVDYVARLICITQTDSFSPLNVSEAMIESIMTEHSVRGEFLDLLSSFYSKIVAVEESFCYPFQIFETAEFLEYMYVFKYAEETHREDYAWAVRQTALYHQIRLSDQRSTYILVSPFPDSVAQLAILQWMKAKTSVTDCKREALMINLQLLESYAKGYRYYVKFYDRLIEDLCLRMHGVGFVDERSMVPKDMADLNFFADRLLPIHAALTGFENVLTALERVFERWINQQRAFRDVNHSWTEAVTNYHYALDAYKNYLEIPLRRCKSATTLLNGIMNYNNQKFAREQSSHTLFLTKATVDDSVTVRVITFITLVFISFTVVAAVMAMPLFYRERETNRLRVSPSFWIFFAVAVPLTFITMGIWKLMLESKRRSRTRELQTRGQRMA